MSTPIYTRSRPYHATIKERKLLSKPGSTKQTWHLSLDLKGSDLAYTVGDSIGVFAQNDPLFVRQLLDVLSASGEESIVDPRSGESFTIREFFSKKANLLRLSSALMKLVYECETDHDKKNEIGHLLKTEHKPLLTQYLSENDPFRFLKEHSPLKLPLQEVCAHFSPLLPRFYSVASSQKVCPDEVHLTVALFHFSHLGEPRLGVASHFLCHLAEHDKTAIPIYVQPCHGFTLPADPNTPIIMIGPGTGVAPFRAFLQERQQAGAKGKNWLFFGERNRSCDFLYEEFWHSLVQTGLLDLSVAFSRDQPEKIYVQHLMQQEAAEIWKWLQEGAILYVCGDAAHMAKDVDHTLHAIVKAQGGMDDDAAKLYLKQLRSEKRYLQDIY
jgi:sulfite reductase (NADPH) flavoprotein alpha-component